MTFSTNSSILIFFSRNALNLVLFSSLFHIHLELTYYSFVSNALIFVYVLFFPHNSCLTLGHEPLQTTGYQHSPSVSDVRDCSDKNLPHVFFSLTIYMNGMVQHCPPPLALLYLIFVITRASVLPILTSSAPRKIGAGSRALR